MAHDGHDWVTQELVDAIVVRASAQKYPPELTHKDGLLEVQLHQMRTPEETLVNVLLNAYCFRSS